MCVMVNDCIQKIYGNSVKYYLTIIGETIEYPL